jgi:hypothetical protein
MSKSLSGLLKVAAVNCDESTTECAWLGVQLYPQVVLLAGGEIVFYAGPMAAKSIFLFANNFISSPVAQIDADLLEWWLKSREICHTCVLMLQDDSSAKIPLAYTSLSRSFADTHCLAEIRDVDKSVKEKFRINKLPSIVSFACHDLLQFKVYGDDDFNKESLERFLRSNISNISSIQSQESINVDALQTFDTCGEMCLITFVDHGSNAPDMSSALNSKLALKSLRKHRRDAQLKVFWMSTRKRMYTTIKIHAPSVALVLWKVKRNRVAIFHGSLEPARIAAFIEDVIVGSHELISLKFKPEELLLDDLNDFPLSSIVDPVPDEDAGEHDDALVCSHGQIVPVGYFTWTCPTNLSRERRKIRSRQYPQPQRHVADEHPMETTTGKDMAEPMEINNESSGEQVVSGLLL